VDNLLYFMFEFQPTSEAVLRTSEAVLRTNP
jgi:hypothetical protein